MKNVLVIFGGVSPEHEVSKASVATVISNMSEEKYNIIPVYITKDGRWLLYDGGMDNLKNIQWEKYGTMAVLSTDRSAKGLLRIVGEKVKTIPIDVVFPVLHGKYGEDGCIQGLFELAGLPYVGCGVFASAVAMDKSCAKIIASSIGLNQADYLAFRSDELNDEAFKKIRYKIGYPCFVKPANTGSSVGISKVSGKKELDAAIQLALQYDNKIIVEKAIVGREFECAVLNGTASGVGEIISAGEFYDYDSKYNDKGSQTIVPADIPEEISEAIRQQSEKIFRAMSCNGLARVDFFVEEETNKVIFNEINTIPGFTSISMFSKLWEERGLSISQHIDALIDDALSRQE